jgi:uncharacterized damage-inducible protein DinB
MSDSLVTLNRFNLAYLKRLLADITDDELDAQPHAELHSVRWILAHLAIAVDYGLMQLDQAFVCPLKWHAAYGPKSQPGSAKLVRPGRDELMEAIETGYHTLCEGLAAASPQELSVPHQVDLLKDTPLTSKRDIISHILTTHFSLHLGQMSAVRRMFGRGPLF